MKGLQGIPYVLPVFLIVVSIPTRIETQTTETNRANVKTETPERDGQHDFDFQIASWKTHVTRLTSQSSGATTRAEYDGVTVVRKIWNGRANLSELEADGPAGHLENLSLRLYNPDTHRWTLNYANSRGGVIDQPPTIGEFKDGRGEFYDMEVINGRNTLVRNVWSDITPTSCRFEQAFSYDAGKTWEPNWIATNTRIQGDGELIKRHQNPPPEKDGQHDFDFNLGNWKTHQSRLLHPLTGSHTWVEYNGTDVIRPIWGGRANIGEVEADGPAGHLELLSLRLYNPHAHQWSFNVAISGTGALSGTYIGEFKNGRAEFIDQEPYNGRTILVRFSVSNISAESCRFEQAFSDDGGKTWEVNFIVEETRINDGSGKNV